MTWCFNKIVIKEHALTKMVLFRASVNASRANLQERQTTKVRHLGGNGGAGERLLLDRELAAAAAGRLLQRPDRGGPGTTFSAVVTK